ncbi:2-amino-3-carboxymuconate-6-semialdehyde decarboxylase [Lentinus tigrinus ALCF2SS1-7]|nr:2-amino-3-carboxymuconate-6-semialdehyde decarboxylase [Lentinus tigrinus ALCF2SS1-7]
MASSLPLKIDVHHHYLPDAYRQALSDAGGDPSGWPTPQWSLSASESLMDTLGTSHAILSVTAPGPDILQGPDSAKLARTINEYGASLARSNPRIGFFAALPSLLDTSAALEELRYALDELGADGVTLFTRYGRGNQYLGDPAFAPIWAELDARAAVVFVHPTSGASVQLVNPTLPLPMLDYPQETTRAAADLIVTGVKRVHPRCKIILSHAGGTLPYLVGRLAMYSIVYPEKGSHAQIVEDAKSFYFDTALSTDKHVLDLLTAWAGPDRILFGSDFPYAPTEGIKYFGKHLDEYRMSEEDRRKIYRENALALFPRFRNASS